jgi:hypothetical protein
VKIISASSILVNGNFHIIDVATACLAQQAKYALAKPYKHKLQTNTCPYMHSDHRTAVLDSFRQSVAARMTSQAPNASTAASLVVESDVITVKK